MIDTITLPRAVVEQALFALVYHTRQTRPIHETGVAVEVLRDALAAPQPEQPEPVARVVGAHGGVAVAFVVWIGNAPKDGNLLYLHPPQVGKTDYVMDDADRALCAKINRAIARSEIADLHHSTIREALELLVQLTVPEPKP